MNILKQKRYLYIPVINFCVIMFCWLLLYYKNNISKIRFVKNVIKIFIIAFIIAIPEILIDKFINVIFMEKIMLLFNVIMCTYIPSLIAIKDQESYLEEQNINL